jgi:hypothetical protein
LSEAVWKDWMSIRIFDDIYLFARILENGCNQVDLDRGSIAVQDLDKIFNLITKQHDL